MLLWFAGVSLVFVWMVFRSPALDYRLVMLGSILPLGEAFFGGPRLLHTLVFSVALLALVMLATQRRRLVRRRWISLPIGLLMHLVLDGIWASSAVFWWPLLGWGFEQEGLPELDRPLLVVLVMEAIGVACLVVMWRQCGFSDPSRRRDFLRTGHLPRDLASSG